MIRLYGFYDDTGKLIDAVSAFEADEAKEKFKKENPDTEYLYMEIIC